MNSNEPREPRTVERRGGHAVTITVANTRAALADVGRFRYEEHVWLLGKPAMHADHQSRTLLEPLDASSSTLVANAGSMIAGTVRVTLRPRFPEQIPWMLPALGSVSEDETSYVSRLLVAEKYREAPSRANYSWRLSDSESRKGFVTATSTQRPL